MTSASKKHQKAKKREAKKKNRAQRNQLTEGHDAEAKKSGRIQVYLIIGMTLLASAIIVYLLS